MDGFGLGKVTKMPLDPLGIEIMCKIALNSCKVSSRGTVDVMHQDHIGLLPHTENSILFIGLWI